MQYVHVYTNQNFSFLRVDQYGREKVANMSLPTPLCPVIRIFLEKYKFQNFIDPLRLLLYGKFLWWSVLQWDRWSQNKHCQNCYNEIVFRDWSTPLFQQSPLYDVTLTGSSKTRSVISLLVEVSSYDWQNISYRVQRIEIYRLTALYISKEFLQIVCRPMEWKCWMEILCSHLSPAF